jgi:hypothetical protein
MSDLGYVNELLDNTNEFYSIAMQQLDFYKELMGTKVRVWRLSSKAPQKKVFGVTDSSTQPGDPNREEFDHVVLINLNDMRNIYQKTAGQIEFYDNVKKLELGDVLIFARKKQEYRFKVNLVESFSEAEGVLFRYQILGQQETTVSN